MDTMLQYKCPCCGGAIAYDGASGKMKCPYCDTEFDLETLKSYDAELKGDKDDELEWKEDERAHFDEESGMNIYVCSSCGGEIIAEETTSAMSCPYCGNPVIFKSQLKGELCPDYLIPFKLDKAAAKAALKKHLSGKKLLPKVFSNENHIDEVKGVYVPFWLFDTDADARARYRALRCARGRTKTTTTRKRAFMQFRAAEKWALSTFPWTARRVCRTISWSP